MASLATLFGVMSVRGLGKGSTPCDKIDALALGIRVTLEITAVGGMSVVRKGQRVNCQGGRRVQ